MVKDLREMCGYTQVTLARLMCVTDMTISNWEIGRAKLSNFHKSIIYRMYALALSNDTRARLKELPATQAMLEGRPDWERLYGFLGAVYRGQ